jgi:YwiC-like protein
MEAGTVAHLAGDIHMQSNSRIRALTFPREHGAWGLLLIPLVTGACIGIPFGHGLGNLTLFLTAALSIFWLRTPVESFLGMGLMRVGNEEENRAVLKTIGYLLPIVAASLAGLFWGGRNMPLLLLGCIGGAAFALQSAVRLFGRKVRLLSQAVGSIGLTSTAAGAYYAVTGHFDQRAIAVWFACWLFAGDQIHYVQMRLRNTKAEGIRERFEAARNFFGGQVLMLAAIVALSKAELLPSLAVIAFVPVALRGFLWLAEKSKPLDLPWLGISELVHGITFGTILTFIFLLHH